jgi:hypothetical protein
MSTDDAHKQRWTLLGPVETVGEFVRGNAIPDYFVAHPEIGSPIDAEADWDGADGGRVQAFTAGVVVWDSDGGARVLSE